MTADLQETARLFGGIDYRASFYAAGAPNGNVVVTFTERTHRDLDGPGFGSQFLLGWGFDVVAVKTRLDTWYQDMPPALIGCVADYLRSADYQISGTYGSSMGGYAALRFAGRLGCDVAVAVSPQYDITTSWDRRWASDARKLASFSAIQGTELSQRCSYVVLFDPTNPDRLHVEEYRLVLAACRFEAISIPHGGHPVGHFLNKGGALAPLVLGALSGKLVRPTRHSIRAARESYPDFFLNLADHCLQRGKRRWARFAIGEALRKSPLNGEYNIRAAQIFEASGDKTTALIHAATAVAIQPAHPHMLSYLASLLLGLGRPSQALHHIDLAIAILPNLISFKTLRERILAAMR